MDVIIVGVIALLVSMPIWIFFKRKYTFEEFLGVVFRIIWFSIILNGILLFCLDIIVFRIFAAQFGIKNPFEKTSSLFFLAAMSLFIVVFVNWRLNVKDKK
jgi:hypothetical protein